MCKRISHVLPNMGIPTWNNYCTWSPHLQSIQVRFGLRANEYWDRVFGCETLTILIMRILGTQIQIWKFPASKGWGNRVRGVRFFSLFLAKSRVTSPIPCLSKTLFCVFPLLRNPNVFLLDSMHYASIWFSVAHRILHRFKFHIRSLTSSWVATRGGFGIRYLLFYVWRNLTTTLNIVFNSTYYINIRNAIYLSIYCLCAN